MITGTVKWFNTTKRFGFIQPEDGGSDVFVHMTALEESGIKGLDEGQRVNYELENSGGKISAVKIQLA
jgi:CspA family cold shock protein